MNRFSKFGLLEFGYYLGIGAWSLVIRIN